MIAHSAVQDATHTPPSSECVSGPSRLMLAATCSDRGDGWPGRNSATIHLHGCDLACAYCCNPEFVGQRRPNTDAERLAEALERRAFDLQGVVISGGEPTHSASLRPLLERLRRVGLPVKLDTNGSAPDVLASLVADELVSFVALDVKALPGSYDQVTRGSGVWERVARSIGIVIASGVDHEFHTTCYPFAVRSDDLPQLASHLVGGRRYVLQQFRPRRTLDPAASTAVPFSADELRRVALRCTVHLPTVVRGV